MNFRMPASMPARNCRAAQVKTFRHNDVSHARALLDAHRTQHDRALIVTDGVFSMDGDLAPLEDLLALAEQYDAWLMSDDAHGIGVAWRRTRIKLFGKFAHRRSAADGHPVERPSVPMAAIFVHPRPSSN